MTKKMLIDAAHAEEVRVCVLDNHVVEDFDFESSSRKPLRGNIYLARVIRVEPSLQAAFVEYGGNRHGFLAFNEIHPDYYQIPVSDRRLLQEAEAEEAALAAELEIDDHEDGETGAANDDGLHRYGALNGEEPRGSDLDGDSSDAEPALDEASTGDDEPADADAADPAPVSESDGEEDKSPSAAFESSPAESVSQRFDSDEGDRETEAARDDPASSEADEDDPEAADAEEPEPDEAAELERERERRARRPELLDRYRDARRRRARLLRNYKIQEVIKRRQILLVQVVKEERGNKGAALTTYMSLAGRYCVLMPNTARGGGISRKIPVAADRKRLKRVVDSLAVPTGMGLIIRTAGAKRTKAEIKRDYEYLIRLWENIRALTLQSIAPCLIYEEANLIKRAIRDLYDKDIDLVIVEGENGYREAKDFMKMLMPSHAKNVQPYKDKTPLFLKHEVESQLDAMYHPVVRLKSGGYIVIHQTEALVAIDVNSGKATRERNIELTALKTNLEAAREAARQCRLRDLAGLIVIDFIDMEENKNNRTVEKRFKDALKTDRARLQIGRISNFGLLEMSRQRRRSGIVDGTTHACPACNGAGVIRSSETAALRILRAIEREALTSRAGTISARCSLEVALYVLNYKREWLKRIETDYGLTVEIVADAAKAGDNYEIEKRGAARDLEVAPQVVRADQTDSIEIAAPESEPAEEIPLDVEDERVEGEARADRPEGEARRRRRRRGRGRGRVDGAAPVAPSPEYRPESLDEPQLDRPSADRDAAQEGEGERERKRRRRGRRGGRRNRNRDDRQPEVAQEEMARVAYDGDEQPAYEAPEPEPVEPLAANAETAEAPAFAYEPPVEDAAAPSASPVVEPPRSDARRFGLHDPVEPDFAASEEAPVPGHEPKPAKKGWWRRAIGE